MAFRWRNRNRWGDDDRNWGPFTYARDRRGYRPLAIMLQSAGDDDEESGDCTLRLSGFGHTVISTMPPIIRPWRRWVDYRRPVGHAYTGGPDEAYRVPTRYEDAGYWDTYPREYGFSFTGSGDVGESTFLQVHFGAQTGDSTTTRDWCTTLPWTDWRHVRHSLYGLNGEHFHTERDGGPYPTERYERMREARERCPSQTFVFIDYDGERLTATTRIEEREWRFGTGWFRWLSLFRRRPV